VFRRNKTAQNETESIIFISKYIASAVYRDTIC